MEVAFRAATDLGDHVSGSATVTLPLDGDAPVPGGAGRSGIRQTDAMTDWTGRGQPQRPLGADHRRLDLLGPGGGGPLRGRRPARGPRRAARLHRRPGAPRWRRPGPSAVTAAFGSISPLGIAAVFDLLDADGFARMWAGPGRGRHGGTRRLHAPDSLDTAGRQFGPDLWAVVDALPLVGRVLFGAHLRMPRPADPALSGWHAVNCLREWRGDTHWALVVAAGLTHAEASILHNAWLGYEDDWLARSRGTSPDATRGRVARRWRRRAWPSDRTVTPDGRRPAPATSRTTPTGSPRSRGSSWERTARSSSPSGSSRRARCSSAGWTRPPDPTTNPPRGCGPADDGADPGTAGPRDRRHPGDRPGHRAGPGRHRAGTSPSPAGRPAGARAGTTPTPAGAGRSRAAWRRPARRVRDQGRRSLELVADLHDHDALRAAVDRVTTDWGGIDLLVNNAVDTAPGSMVPILDLDVAQLEAKLAANAVAPFVLIQAVLPGMLATGRGTIVDVTSHTATADPPGPVGQGGWGVAYAASKAAAHRFAPLLAVELGDRGIRAYNLDPGLRRDRAPAGQRRRPRTGRPLPGRPAVGARPPPSPGWWTTPRPSRTGRPSGA